MKEDIKYVTFWGRFWAVIFDIALLGLLFKILDKYFKEAFATYAIATISTLAVFLYRAVMHGFFGKTLGKMLFSLVVLKSDETKIRFPNAFLRELFPIAALSLFVVIAGPILSTSANFEMEWKEFSTRASIPEMVALVAISVLYMLWELAIFVSMQLSPKSRSVQDIISGTVIVRERDYRNYGIVLIILLIVARFIMFRG